MQIEVIGSFAFIFSCFACLFQQAYFRRYRKEINRENLTGSEAARAVCEALGFAQTVIDSKKQKTPMIKGPGEMKFLFLPPRIYEGKTLAALARAGHEAVLMAESPISFFPLKRCWLIITLLSCAAWFFLSAHFLTGFAGFHTFAALLFSIGFVASVFFVPEEWEIAEKVTEIYQKKHTLELDEALKIKEMMRGFRLESFALIVKAPAALLIRSFTRQGPL